MRKERDAIVIGGGVVGVATAWALARRGLRVTIVDMADGPATRASFANGAQLSYAYVDALASPAIVKRLPWLALGLDPSFRMRLASDPELIRWGLAFLREGSRARFEANTRAQLALAFESRAALHALLDAHPLDFGHAAPGKIHLYDTEADFAAGRRMLAFKAPLGAHQQALTPAEAIAIEPALAERAKGIAGAIFTPGEEVGDPHRFARALTSLLVRDYGVETRFGFRIASISAGTVTGASGERIEADTVFVCTGADTPRLLRPLGVRVPILAMKGYSITAAPGPAAPRVSITDGARRLVFCCLDGKMRIAGLAELGNRDPQVDPRRLAMLVASAREALPGSADWDRIESNWAGLRPMTPSSRPIIAKVAPGVILNAGHGILGWTLAMGSAERAAALLD